MTPFVALCYATEIVTKSEVRRPSPPTEAPSIQCVGAPNGKPHLMRARRAIVDADMRFVSFRQWVHDCEMHFSPAPALGQFSEAGHIKAR